MLVQEAAELGELENPTFYQHPEWYRASHGRRDPGRTMADEEKSKRDWAQYNEKLSAEQTGTSIAHAMAGYQATNEAADSLEQLKHTFEGITEAAGG